MIGTTGFIIILAVYFIAAHIALYKFFERAGEKGWRVLIPVYSVIVALKIVKKPIWWLFLYYVPFLGLMIAIGIIVEFLKAFNYLRFYQHVLGVVAAPVYLIWAAFNKETKFIGPSAASKYKKTFLREWADALAFAVIAATLIRSFFIEAFTIPTSSMEKSLLVGDYLFVSKLSYGVKFPNTPLSFPFAHHTMPLTEKTKSYLEWIKLPYHRFPSFKEIENNDVVVFNYPEGDTVVVQKQDQSYHQLVRDYGRDLLWQNFDITVRPVDKRENYIKRCVGIPGDTLEIIDKVLLINGKELASPENKQFSYSVTTDGTPLSPRLLDKLDITDDVYIYNAQTSTYRVTLSESQIEKMKELPFVLEIKENIAQKGQRGTGRNSPIFPHHEDYDWTEDNFGPLYIPKKGVTLKLTLENLPLYKRAIRIYEGNDVKVKEGKIFINGNETDEYTFEMDYYFMMGDNRHNSADSRFWGFVPEDHVVGRAVLVWLSLDKNKSFPQKIRWNRVMSLIK